MPPALGAPAPTKYIPSPNLMTPASYLENLVYSAAGEPVPAAAPVATENSAPAPAPAPSGDPYGGYYQSSAAPAPAPVALGGDPAPVDPYTGQPIGAGQYGTTDVGLGFATSTQQAAAPAMDPYGGYAGLPAQATLASENDPYGAYGAAEPLPASGQNNWAPSWNLDEGVRTAQRAGTWIGQGLGILPQTAYAQQEEGLTDQVGGGGGGRGSTGGAPSRGGLGGRPLDSEPGGVRAARQGMVPGSVRVGDSPTVNPAVNRGATLPSSEPIGVGGRRIINNSATAPPSSPRNMGQIQSGANAVQRANTPIVTSRRGTWTGGTSTQAPRTTSQIRAGATPITVTQPPPTTPPVASATRTTVGAPGTPRFGQPLSPVGGLARSAALNTSGGMGWKGPVTGAIVAGGTAAAIKQEIDRQWQGSANTGVGQGATGPGSALSDPYWTSGTRDYLEDRGVRPSAPANAVDPYANTTGGTSSGAQTATPVVNDGDVSRNRAAKLLTPDLQFVTSERTSDAFGGGTGSYSLRVIHGEPGAPMATDAIVTPDSMAAAQAAGMAPWMLNDDEFAALVEAGLITEDAKAQVVGKPLLIPGDWAEALGTSGDTLTDVQAVDPYTAPATDTSSDSGSGWVDYGNGGGGGYRRRSSSSGSGGGGYSRSYGGGGGYSGGGGGSDWGGGGFDMSWLPEGFGGEDGFMSGSFDSPIFARYFDVLSRHMGEERAMSLLQGMRGMKRGFKRSKRSRTRSMSGGRTLTTKRPRQSSVDEGLNVPSNDSVRKDVGKQIRKSTKDKEA